ncbi:MAG TPA: protein-glutamate O-methyltransferase CheR [Gammaproteobacteria bacterium]|nr:protein-glutamate O-methyltransferase CheR [Gammaproteobacteria bacterium]
MKALPTMEDAEFAQWISLLESRTGMCLPPERKSFLVTSLAIRMREIGCVDYRHYYQLVTSSPTGVIEWSVLVDRLTIHETRFFRHPSSLDALQEYFIARSEPALGPVSVDVWSAGCATGEEPYTLAMLIDHQLALRGGEYYIGVSATDISLAALATGRRGVYHQRKLANVPVAFIEQYFIPIDNEHYQVCPSLRERVCFSQMNVTETQRAMGKMDIIFCQNVLIYFNAKRRIQILNNFAASLKPGGILILGPGEIVNWAHAEMEYVRYADALVYRRRPDPILDRAGLSDRDSGAALGYLR